MGKTDLVKADEVLAAAEELLARWSAEEVAAGAEHEDLLARSGANVLDRPEDSGRIADQMSRLESRKQLAGNAVAEARRRVEQAQRGVLVARAAELRQRAARLRTTVAVRERKTDALLKQLRDHEGADFVAFVPSMESRNPGEEVMWRVPWTTIALRTVTQLEVEATELARLAADGSAEQVAAAVGRPVADPLPVERLPESGVLVASATRRGVPNG